MAAGATVDNAVPWGKAPGTESEQTELSAQAISIEPHVSPDLDFTPGEADDCSSTTARTASRSDTTYAPAAAAWKTVK
jgi:hypothetical protein